MLEEADPLGHGVYDAKDTIVVVGDENKRDDQLSEATTHLEVVEIDVAQAKE